MTELARSCKKRSTVGHATDERQRGESVTELARSPINRAPLAVTRPTSASEEKA